MDIILLWIIWKLLFITINYQSHKKNLKINDSLKLSKYKNDEKINFPPKKSDNKQANIISGKNSKIKISKSMRNKRKKESAKVKIVGDSAKKLMRVII